MELFREGNDVAYEDFIMERLRSRVILKLLYSIEIKRGDGQEDKTTHLIDPSII